MIPMTAVTRDSLDAFMFAGFRTLGLSDADARLFADALIFSELRFHPGHGQGVKRLRRYHERISQGLVDPQATWEVVKESPALALVDAHNGIGTVAASRAMRLAIDKAKVCGIGQVVVRNSTHYGSSAVHACQAAEAGCIGISMTNAGPEMAPWGAREGAVGTNPWGIAAPTDRGFPAVMDIALTTAGKGMMQWHAREGRAMPLDWALTPEGHETDDPDAAMAGALLGIGTYKGYGLAFMTDVLTGVIGGGGFGLKPYADPAKLDVSHTLTAIDIDVVPAARRFPRPDGPVRRHGEIARPAARVLGNPAAGRTGGASCRRQVAGGRAARRRGAGRPAGAGDRDRHRRRDNRHRPVGGRVVTPLPAPFRAMLRDRLSARAQTAGLDGLLLLAPGNVGYASGWKFSIHERPMGLWLPGGGDPVLFVPHLELENAEAVPGVTVRTYPEFPGEVPPVLSMLAETGAKRIGIDSLDASLLAPARDIARIDLTDHCLPERSVKHPEELVLHREAARFADMVLERFRAVAGDMIAQGATELDLEADCTGHARAAMATQHNAAFAGTKMGITSSVHSGPRAALPHGAVLHRVPQPGEPIIVGIGASLGGYHAESAATFVLGDLSADQRHVMTAMAASNDATRDALARRLTCAAVNAAALAPIRAAGLGAAIRHRIGHGMGVEGHEAPWLSIGDPTPTAPGMVFSCEPGVYRPGHDGWRTIETLIVTDGATETPSRFQSTHDFDSRVL